MIAGLILAAGASSRMGFPKALLEFEGATFLDRLIAAFGAHCRPVIVVLGYHADKVRAGVQRGGEAVFVVNPTPERGQLSSLQCGLRAVPAGCRGVFFAPVDYPKVREATIGKLAAAARNTTTEKILVPQSSGVHGHPVYVDSELITEFLDLQEGSTARDVIHRWRERTAYVEVDDDGIVRDVDDPESYRRLIEG